MIFAYYQDTDFRLKSKQKSFNWLRGVAINFGYRFLNLNYIFCSDEKILSINRQFLSHNYYTDVITFDNIEDEFSKKSKLSGDIFISVDTVLANSTLYKCSFDTELHRVMVHGMLHLMGYDDATPEQQTAIHLLEDNALKLYRSNG